MKGSAVAVWGAVGLIGVLLGGCSSSGSNRADGGGGTGGGGGSGGGRTGGGGGSGGGGPGTACNDYVAKYCARAQACEPGALTLAGFTSLADCASYFLPYCNDAFAAPHTGQTVALLKQCGDAIAALSCTDFLQKGLVVPACRPQGGTIANGGSCNNDWQCASGSCWDLYVDSCGTCAEVTSVGQPCQVDADFGAVCPHDLLCALTPTSPITPVCSPPVPMGGACVQTEVCPLNAYCDPITNVCTQLPALGQACNGAASYECDPTQAASACEGTCVPASAVHDGQPCNGGDLRCAGVCVNINDAGVGTCHVFRQRGEPCTDNDLCTFDTTCTAGVCTAPVCGGAVAAQLTPAGAVERRPIVHLSQVPGQRN
jgi:hypothetical protein